MNNKSLIENQPSQLMVWCMAVRPRTLTVGLTPVLVGTATARHAGLSLATFIATLTVAMGLQIGSNLINDAADFESGADDADRIGPPRAAQRGWLTPRALWVGAAISLTIAVGAGAWLIAQLGWPFLVTGAASVLAAAAYTAGPRLGYRGLGDVMVFIFFGLVAVIGTDWAHTGAPRLVALLAAIPIGALATAVLVVNNLRDRITDERAGKRTLIVRWGERAGRLEYVFLIMLALGLPILSTLSGLTKPGWLLTLLVLPIAIRTTRRVWTTDGAALNPLLGQTAQLQLLYALALCAGIIIWS